MRLVGYPEGRDRPQHGTLPEDMLFMAECALATVESMAMLKSKSKSEFERQKRLAKFAVSSCIFHRAHLLAERQQCGRVQKIVDRYYQTEKLTMPWEEEHGNA